MGQIGVIDRRHGRSVVRIIFPLSAMVTFGMGLGACAVRNYDQPITEFSEAARNAESALEALDGTVTDAYFARLRDEIAAGTRFVRVESGNCDLTSERCRLVAVTREGDSQQYPPDPLLGNMVVLMEAMTDYADGLAAIVKADTANQVATAVNNTLGSVNNLAESIDEISGTQSARSVAAYKTPLGKAVNFLVGHYVERVKIKALRHATRQADPVIARASEIFEGAGDLAGDLARRAPVAAFDSARDQYEDSKSAADLKNMVAKAAAYDRVLTARPSSVYSAFRKSHGALTDHLSGKNQSIAEVFASIERFYDEAKRLMAVAHELATVEVD